MRMTYEQLASEGSNQVADGLTEGDAAAGGGAAPAHQFTRVLVLTDAVL